MKAISSTLAVVLILMITVALAAMAYVFTIGTYEETTEVGTRQAEVTAGGIGEDIEDILTSGCGDEECDENENCEICPQDCGECLPENLITVCQDGTCDSVTIQAGIDLAEPGYTVMITDRGTYYNELVNITTDSITLDCNNAMMYRNLQHDMFAINLTSQDVTIQNCNIKNYTIGIFNYEPYITGYTKIINNTLDNSTVAIMIGDDQQDTFEITGNRVLNSLSSGIHVGISGTMTLTDNIVCSTSYNLLYDYFCTYTGTIIDGGGNIGNLQDGELCDEPSELSLTPCSNLAIIRVCKAPACDADTIQGGIDLASPGQTVRIMDAQIYNDEEVIIDKNDITLDCGGATMAKTIVGGTGIDVEAANVIVKNCIMNSYGVGISFASTANTGGGQALANEFNSIDNIAIHVSDTDDGDYIITDNIINNDPNIGIRIGFTGTITLTNNEVCGGDVGEDYLCTGIGTIVDGGGNIGDKQTAGPTCDEPSELSLTSCP